MSRKYLPLHQSPKGRLRLFFALGFCKSAIQSRIHEQPTSHGEMYGNPSMVLPHNGSENRPCSRFEFA